MNKHWTVSNLLPQLKLIMRMDVNSESINRMRTLGLIMLVVWSLVSLVSCKQVDVDANATATTFAANETDINNYAVSHGISGSTTSSGLFVSLTLAQASSTSALAAYQDELEFTYKLYVLSGPSNSTVTSATATNSTVVTDRGVDSAYATTPTFVPFFQGVLKAGLEEGLLQMHEGDSAVFLVPSKLAFGNVISPDGLIPANSPVRYNVKLRRARTEAQRLTDYAVTTGLSFSTTASGLRIAKTKTTTDSTVTSALTKNQVIAIKYVGKQLYAQTAIGFDSTGSSSIQYKAANFVSGFIEAVSSMRVGESATILFPSSLGYSSNGVVTGAATNKTYLIPPYTPLRYDITVVSAR